ncbi:hypothetical protein ACFL3J_00800 [Candidatus Omnitrophota bacterium]
MKYLKVLLCIPIIVVLVAGPAYGIPASVLQAARNFRNNNPTQTAARSAPANGIPAPVLRAASNLRNNSPAKTAARSAPANGIPASVLRVARNIRNNDLTKTAARHVPVLRAAKDHRNNDITKTAVRRARAYRRQLKENHVYIKVYADPETGDIISVERNTITQRDRLGRTKKVDTVTNTYVEDPQENAAIATYEGYVNDIGGLIGHLNIEKAVLYAATDYLNNTLNITECSVLEQTMDGGHAMVVFDIEDDFYVEVYIDMATGSITGKTIIDGQATTTESVNFSSSATMTTTSYGYTGLRMRPTFIAIENIAYHEEDAEDGTTYFDYEDSEPVSVFEYTGSVSTDYDAAHVYEYEDGELVCTTQYNFSTPINSYVEYVYEDGELVSTTEYTDLEYADVISTNDDATTVGGDIDTLFRLDVIAEQQAQAAQVGQVAGGSPSLAKKRAGTSFYGDLTSSGFYDELK